MMQFNRALFASFLLVFIAVGVIYTFLIQLHPEDSLSYHKLVQASAELRSHKALEKEPAHQFRKGVQKDIWMTKGENRVQFKLNSAESHLILSQNKKKLEAVEHLSQIKCLMQESIDPTTSTQQLRALDAKAGTYYFPSHRFTADTVHLAFYQSPGLELPSSLEMEQPFLTGIAQQTTFSMSDKQPHFKARFLKIHLDPKRELR